MDKFPRIKHFPFSPGIGRDDLIAKDWFKHLKGKHVVITEKMDGSNTCINQSGVYARSPASIASHKSFDFLKSYQATVRHQLSVDGLNIFGENLYAIHSITYENLPASFFVFAMITDQVPMWFDWNSVNSTAKRYGLDVVPSLDEWVVEDERQFERMVTRIGNTRSIRGEREGVVVRVLDAFNTKDFDKSIFKYVRANHVKSVAHWSVNWSKALLPLR